MSDLFATPNEAAESIGFTFSGTSKEDIHVEASVMSALGNIMICNTTGSAITLDLFWYQSGTSTEYQIWSSESFAANSYTILSMGALTLSKDDEIRGQASAVGLTLVLNMAETAGRIR